MKSPHSLSALFRSVRRIAALTPMVLLPFAGRSQSLQPPSPPCSRGEIRRTQHLAAHAAGLRALV